MNPLFNFHKLSLKFQSKRIYLDLDKRKRHSLYDLSLMVGISEKAISRLVASESISINQIIKVCFWIEIPIQEFIASNERIRKEVMKK